MAADGQHALDWAAHSTASLAILDLHMPRHDGFTVMLGLREKMEWVSVPLLSITASAMGEGRQRALEAGSSGFLTKPFTPDELRKIVRRLLEK